MAELPRISIVTPSFNQAAFLEKTIRSVLDQDYPNLEYCVVDGGSTDGSVDIIRKYERQLSWWVSEPDHGQADAINKGFQRATGEIVAWLNSDDLYLAGAFEKALAAFQKFPEAGFVFGDVVSINGEGRTTNVMRYGDWGLEDLMVFSIIGQPAVFMRRSCLEQARQNGLYLDPRYRYLLDHQLWLRMASQAPMVHIPAALAAARFHAGAKNVAQAAGFGQEAYAIVEWMRTQPQLAKKARELSPRIHAAADRFNARYLLDGNQPRLALKAYWRSLVTHPATALVEWHRMVYAGLCLIGLGKLKSIYLSVRYSIRRKKDPNLYG